MAKFRFNAGILRNHLELGETVNILTILSYLGNEDKFREAAMVFDGSGLSVINSTVYLCF